jgi:hypothetical protein
MALNGKPSPYTGTKVVLTVAHLDHTPENCADENLKAMCQGCHLAYDADHHAETAAATRAAELAAQMDPLFPAEHMQKVQARLDAIADAPMAGEPGYECPHHGPGYLCVQCATDDELIDALRRAVGAVQ